MKCLLCRVVIAVNYFFVFIAVSWTCCVFYFSCETHLINQDMSDNLELTHVSEVLISPVSSHRCPWRELKSHVSYSIPTGFIDISRYLVEGMLCDVFCENPLIAANYCYLCEVFYKDSIDTLHAITATRWCVVPVTAFSKISTSLLSFSLFSLAFLPVWSSILNNVYMRTCSLHLPRRL